MFSEGNYSLADIAAATNNDGMFGGNGSWWIILLFLFIMNNGWGNGYNRNGAEDNYVLASDFATLQRQIDASTDRLSQQSTSIANGLCDGFYTQAQLINGVNMNIAQNGYESRLATQTLGSQMSNCCCDIREGISNVNYNNAMNTNMIQKSLSDGFCQTNYAIDKVGDRVIDYLAQQEAQRLRDENSTLRLAASQQAQNNILISQLKAPTPIPAYVVANPYSSYPTCGCGIA